VFGTPRDVRPLSVLPEGILLTTPEFVRVSAHAVQLDWTDGLGTSLFFFADDEEGRRFAAALRDGPSLYTVKEQVHPRVWCVTGTH
jgi:hypothetical protein